MSSKEQPHYPQTFQRVLMMLAIVSLITLLLVQGAAFAAATVTIAGDLQTELGCTSDWDPTCSTTDLVDMGGGIWRGAFAVPTGTFEYKLALDADWAVAYPDANVSLALTVPQTVTFYLDENTGGVLDTVNNRIPVATGEIQAAAGCTADWMPECVLTLMTDPDGDGIYTYATTGLLAGDYNFKTAFDEGWGNGEQPPVDNVLCTVAADNDLTTFMWNAADDAVTCMGPSAGNDPTLTAAPITHTIQDDTFYFLMTDRFENGDASNDEGATPGGALADTGFLPSDKSFYHGGDLAGLTSRLDYIADLGVSGIWITPVFENIPTQSDSSTDFGIGGAYHGYWILDYENTDPHLGTNAELQTLINAAHARGIKVFFDIVVNHTADVIDYAEGTTAYISKDDAPYVDAAGVEFNDDDYADGTNGFPTLSPTVSFPYTPVLSGTYATAKSPNWLNDPIYYHNRGDSTFSGENSLYGDFFGLDDVFTEHPDVVAGFTQVYKDWITDYGIDGFRLDTVKHVNDEFWQQFIPDIMAHAASEGNDDFYIFGEVFSGDPVQLSYYTTEAAVPSVLDFGLQGATRSFVLNGNTDSLRDTFINDDYYIDADSNAYGLANFISNHDGGLERLGYYIQDGNAGASDAELVDRLELGHAVIFFSRGFPIVYYGDEQGFTGGTSDKLAREDMMPSLVPEYNANDLIGTDDTTAVSNFDQTHPVYETIAAYDAVRDDHLALRRGAQIHRYSEDQAGIYAFSRIERGERIEYIVAMNNSTAVDSATFDTFSPDTSFTAVMGASDVITSAADGTLSVSVDALSTVIYRADTAAPCGTETPTVTLDVPDALTGRVEIPAMLSSTENYAEVTFAVSSDGGATYTVIGTDDNAPYRVFYDVSDMPVDTSLTFQAVVDDLCPDTENTVAADTGTVVTVAEAADNDLPKYAIVHYNREDGEYGDPTATDYTEFWAVHSWNSSGEALPEEVQWTDGIRLWGEDDFGAFAYIELNRLAAADSTLGFILHKGDDKNTPNDLFFNPFETPEIWINEGDETIYTSQAEAQGYITVHYNRDDGDYTDWGLHLWQDGWSTDWGAPITSTVTDTYGAVYTLTTTLLPDLDLSQPINFIMHKGDDKSPADSPDRQITTDSIWIRDADDAILSEGDALNKAIIHFQAPDGDYGDYTSTDYADFWGLHVWQDTTDSPGWTDPIKPIGFDDFGAIFEVNLTEDATAIGYLFHRGDEKDPGPDQFLTFAESGYEVWQLSGADPECPYVYPVATAGAAASASIDLKAPTAYWVDQSTIVWPGAEDAALTYALHYTDSVALEEADGGVTGHTLVLTHTGTYDAAAAGGKFPHLDGLPSLTLDTADLAMVPDILRGHFAIVGSNADGAFVGATAQIPGVLDDLYAENAYNESLGVVWDGDVPTMRVWAPTAQSVTLHVFDDSAADTTSTTYPMVWDATNGIWSYEGASDWTDKYYLYEVNVWVNSECAYMTNVVTDPYSHSLSTNSQRSQIVDLSTSDLKPPSWDLLQKPNPVKDDISIYELHVRDFSIADETVTEAYRGTYKAFTEDSAGMAHINALVAAGLTHVHLLPTFDIATINEDAAARTEPDTTGFDGLGPDSDEQQTAIRAVWDDDGFNWGYDPYHYTTPEGSYSTNPDGTTRIVEYREMVQSLNNAGAKVVMDVVYNHTSDAGQSEKSVLDRIVPGYYHRLDDAGNVETSTCCQNTASEHTMFEKLMIDSLVTWAVEYKVDAFRFDLMGHHSKQNLLNVRAALDALTVENDGIDGSQIYLYGEGWNFGEVQDNARFEQATQLNMAGTGIGTFSDRLRDAIRGPGPFDGGADLLKQGFANGLSYDPNDHVDSDNTARLMALTDQIRVGLAANLAGYQFTDNAGNVVTGADVDYNGQPTGYAQTPRDTISYISKHDNQTLYDINAYALPTDTSMADRVRVQNLGLSLVTLGQGVPFYHGASDILRSKSLDRNSYNSGDWYNSIDWTYEENGFGVGLPPEPDNGENYDIMRPILTNTLLMPTQADIVLANTVFREFSEIRQSSKLFCLETAADIQARMTFHNTGPDQLEGLIVMSLSDAVDGFESIDTEYERIVVLFNANDEEQTFTEADWIGEGMELHPVQVNSADAVVTTSSYVSDTGTFTIPGRTTAVFVLATEPTSLTMSVGESSVVDAQPLPWALISTITLGALVVGGLVIANRRPRSQ